VTVQHALLAAAETLRSAGVDSPRLDAELLLAHVLGVSRTQLLVHPEQELSEAQARAFEMHRDWRATRVPLPYLTGTREFFGRAFFVNQQVLIPRPETETLVEAVLGWQPPGFTAHPTLLDVGTGSGCIAISLALGLPGSRVIGMDLSGKALEVARRNADALGAARVELREARFPEGVEDLEEVLDILVSNPPYIGPDESLDLPPEVRDFEPQEALYAGDCGLEVIQSLLDNASRLLKPGGLLALEVGFRQAPEVLRRAQKAGLASPRAVRDLSGIERVVLAERPAQPRRSPEQPPNHA
jgi:release factor glutamine methyltransferase